MSLGPDLNKPARLGELIAAGRKLVEADRAPDSKDISEQIRLELDRVNIENRNLLTLTELRRIVGRHLISFMWVYFSVSIVMLLLNGFHPNGFALPSGVGLALVGGTAVSIIGVVGTLVSGLFGQPSTPPTSANTPSTSD